MGNIIMEMINGNGYLLIPGFVASSLLLFGYCKAAGHESAKAVSGIISRKSNGYIIRADRHPVMK